MPDESGTFALAGGGTGGHVFPAIAVAREIRRRRPSARVVFIGNRNGLEAVIAPREGFPIEFVPASGFVGRGPAAKARALFDLARGVSQSRRVLARERPTAVLGVGGYASLPVLAAARLAGIPVMVQEQNSVPGIANRLGARMARVAAAGFEAACRRLPGRCVWTGNPVREEFFRVPAGTGGRRVLLFGGSQGARVLNRALVDAAPALAAAGVGVTAQTGERELESIREALVPWPGVVPVAFIEAMADAFSSADLVVSRAGALSLAEIAAAGRPSILVPFAAATHAHQEENARVCEAAGAAVVIPEVDLDGKTLARAIVELLGDPDRLRRMGEEARKLAKPDAAEKIVDLLFEIAR